MNFDDSLPTNRMIEGKKMLSIVPVNVFAVVMLVVAVEVIVDDWLSC